MTLVPLDGNPGDEFGNVVVSTNDLIVGSYGRDKAGNQAGAVYIFSSSVGANGDVFWY